MIEGKADPPKSRSLSHVLLLPLTCLLIVVPLALAAIYYLERSALADADERYASAAALHAADLISLTYDEVSRNYSRMVPEAKRLHLELNRDLPEAMENVDVHQLAGGLRERLPEGLRVDCAVVTDSLVIHDTTYGPEKGLDLSNFADAVADFEEARNTKAVAIAFPVVESVGTHVRLYSHMLSPSGRYFTQLAFFSQDANLLFRKMRDLLSEQGTLTRADIFLVSQGGQQAALPQIFHFNRQPETGPAEDSRVRDAVAQLVDGDETFIISWAEDRSWIEYYRRADLDPDLVGALPFGAVVCVQLDTQLHLQALSTHRALVLVAIIVVLGALVLVSFVLRRAIQEPLSELAAHIDQKAPVHSGERIQQTLELSVIAERFNEHLAEIQRGKAAMQDLYAESEERLSDRTNELRALSRRLLSVQEDEMRRISQELHDGFSQTLVGLRLKLSVLTGILPGNDAKACGDIVAECGDILDQSLVEVRHLIDILRPAALGKSGLAGALKWLGGQYGDLIAVKVTAAESVPKELDEEIAVSAYRIAQEAIGNALKHSESDAVNVALDCDSAGTLTLVIEDKGVGFEPERQRDEAAGIGHYGLDSMSERAKLSGGSLLVRSKPGEGTHIEARWKLNESGA
jgi:signal transduction histidine kinase